MNEDRRKRITEIVNSLGPLQSSIETLRDEEQEYYDNMPEGLHNSEKGELTEAAIEALTEAANGIEEAVNSLENAGA